ncbi:hypothetical protein Tco_1191032 [Tanacetum coccineum]
MPDNEEYKQGETKGTSYSNMNVETNDEPQEASTLGKAVDIPAKEYDSQHRHAHTFLDHDSKHQSCGSCVVAAATVGIPASIRRLPKNLLDRVSQLR